MKKERSSASLPFFGVGKILPFIKKYRKMFALMLFFCLTGSLFDIASPLFQRYALNHFIAGNTLDGIVYYALIYLLFLVGAGIMNYISCVKAQVIEVSVNRDIRNIAFAHLQTLSFSYYNQNNVGYIHSRVMSDASRIGLLLSWTSMDFIWHSTYFIGSVTVMFIIHARLAALVVIIVPIMALLFSVFQKKLTDINRKIRELNSGIVSDFNEGITGAKTVKSLVIEDDITDSFLKDTEKMRKTTVNASRLQGLFSSTLHFASSVALAIVLWQGGYIAKAEIGTFSMFMSYAQGMMEPVRWLVDVISTLIATQVNIERLTTLISTESEVKDSEEVTEKYGDLFDPKKENWEELHGDIEFRNVDFKYPDGKEYILENFCLKIPFGTNIAIVGETGAGKSTLVNLICRFFEPTAGQILIDGRDARERSQLWLHSSIGYVLQTPHLFSGTVRENLQYGNPEADDKTIFEALKKVSAYSVIEKLENGLDSNVGEGGDLLSTGEKQLLSFARAILAEPKILILDEATASVDTLTEQKIQNAIKEIIKGRTSVVIAHRLSTVENSDIIIAVRDGKIVEHGTHSELMALKGYYFDLYNSQFEDEQAEAILGEFHPTKK